MLIIITAMEVSAASVTYKSLIINGWIQAQHIFYEDPSVLYVSLHAENDYPCMWNHSDFSQGNADASPQIDFTGFSSETGEGEGERFNINVPLPRGTTGDQEYCEALSRVVSLIKDFDPAYLLVR